MTGDKLSQLVVRKCNHQKFNFLLCFVKIHCLNHIKLFADFWFYSLYNRAPSSISVQHYECNWFFLVINILKYIWVVIYRDVSFACHLPENTWYKYTRHPNATQSLDLHPISTRSLLIRITWPPPRNSDPWQRSLPLVLIDWLQFIFAKQS